jgi:hypothetical protein
MTGKVPNMTDEYTDPSGNTAQFQAFAQRAEQPVAPAKRAPVAALVGVAAAIIMIAAVVVYLLMS